jgi:hypothetical protein
MKYLRRFNEDIEATIKNHLLIVRNLKKYGDLLIL